MAKGDITSLTVAELALVGAQRLRPYLALLDTFNFVRSYSTEALPWIFRTWDEVVLEILLYTGKGLDVRLQDPLVKWELDWAPNVLYREECFIYLENFLLGGPHMNVLNEYAWAHALLYCCLLEGREDLAIYVKHRIVDFFTEEERYEHVMYSSLRICAEFNDSDKWVVLHNEHFFAPTRHGEFKHLIIRAVMEGDMDVVQMFYRQPITVPLLRAHDGTFRASRCPLVMAIATRQWGLAGFIGMTDQHTWYKLFKSTHRATSPDLSEEQIREFLNLDEMELFNWPQGNLTLMGHVRHADRTFIQKARRAVLNYLACKFVTPDSVVSLTRTSRKSPTPEIDCVDTLSTISEEPTSLSDSD